MKGKPVPCYKGMCFNWTKDEVLENEVTEEIQEHPSIWLKKILMSSGIDIYLILVWQSWSDVLPFCDQILISRNNEVVIHSWH